jgi:hypothetical protein
MALYELRTYTLRVGAMAEAVKLYQELGFPALQRGGHDKKLIGYFQSDTGTINQLVHLWKFEDDTDRRAHWSAVFCEQRLRGGIRLEIPPIGDDPGGEAPSCCAVGTSSVDSKPAPRRGSDAYAFRAQSAAYPTIAFIGEVLAELIRYRSLSPRIWRRIAGCTELFTQR